MNSSVLEPKKLRPEIIQRVEAMDDESLLVLHRVLLVERESRCVSRTDGEDPGTGTAEAEQDRRSGKLERLPEIIRAARDELRKG